jgi:tRNA A-37 threonylcarbamoyl transferase component Bud32
MTVALPNTTARTQPQRLLARLVESIKINSIDLRPSDRIVRKHRSWLSRGIANLSNFYFHIAQIPIRFSTTCVGWQHREINSFRKLNPAFTAYPTSTTTVCAQKLPGKNLFDHLKQKTLTRQMLIAAAKEYRRAHNTRMDGAPWTHGDATMSNVIYDPKSHRARLIDFELHHLDTIPLNQRRADDLLVFLLDLVSYTSNKRWLPLATAFLNAYNNPEVTHELLPMLNPPNGLARIWFSVRTNWQEPMRIAYRLKQLRETLTKNNDVKSSNRQVVKS